MAGPIVVGVDGSDPSHAAVEWAAADARDRRLPLKILHVCEQWRDDLDGRKYCAGVVEAAAGRAREIDAGIAVETELTGGNVVDTLIARSASADSTVLGSRGMGGFAGLLLGSVTMGVAGHAQGPVVVVRSPTATRHDQIVVGDDGSDTAREAMLYSVEQARARRARIVVLHAWQQPLVSAYGVEIAGLLAEAFEEECHAARERVAAWREQHPDVEITGRQVAEHPVPALADASASADLVVVGSRGLGGFASAVLGSVGHGLLHHAECPVAVVRPRQAQ